MRIESAVSHDDWLRIPPRMVLANAWLAVGFVALSVAAGALVSLIDGGASRTLALAALGCVVLGAGAMRRSLSLADRDR